MNSYWNSIKSTTYWFARKLFKITIAIITRLINFATISCLAFYYIGEALVLSVTPKFLRTEKCLKNKTILVTGGAGGVGQELTLRLARNKARVIIWDNNEKALEKIREKIEMEGHKVHTYNVDVSDKMAVYKNADLLKNDVGPIDILINNAGIVCGQTLLNIPDYMIEKTYKVNILSHYWTTKAFLPDMLKNGAGHIVTVGSLTGLLGTYNCTDYSATKFATIGFHESLLTELKTEGHHNIHMTLICPYFINTNMFSGCKPKNVQILESKDVAKRMITAIKREEIFVTMPEFFRFILPLKNYIPAKLLWELVYRVFNGPQTMKELRNFSEVEAA